MSRSALHDVMETLQTFIGALDGTGLVEKSHERRLLNQIAQLSPCDQQQIVEALAKLLVSRGRFESRVVADQVREVLTARAADGPTAARQAFVLVSLLPRVSRPDGDPESLSDIRVSSETDRVRMAVRFLESNACRPISLDKVAEHVGWSRWHCARVFKRHTGCGIAEFYRRIRVNRARRLLADPTLTIKEVAAAAGFTHPSDLTRCFLRAYGISPSHFRKVTPVAESS